MLYNLLVLGIIPGTNYSISFWIWCLLLAALIIFAVAYITKPKVRASTDLTIILTEEKLAALAQPLLSRVARYEGLPVEPQIFQQVLAPRIVTFVGKLLDSLKIDS